MTRSDSVQYKAPTRGFLSYLPLSWVPFVELMRLHKPVGVLNIYFPYLFGSIFAASISDSVINPRSLLVANARLFAMAFILRSAGCTWNDIIDRDLDRQVARCRLRPMARKAISPRTGYVFFTAQMLPWMAIVLATGQRTWPYAFIAVVLAQLYPFAKRVTDYSQIVLGITLSWGTLVGCVLQDVYPTQLVFEQPSMAMALGCLYLTYVLWTVIHDTVYAFQDVQDDAKAGVKSMCLIYQRNPTSLLSSLAIMQVGLQLTMGAFVGAGSFYYLGACASAFALLACMILKLDVRDPTQCWWWFQYGSLMMGASITLGMLGEYLDRYFAAQNDR